MGLDSKDKKELAKKRRDAAKQAQQYHRNQEKQKKASEKTKKPKKGKTKKVSEKRPQNVSKITEAVNSGKASTYENISREEKYLRESDEKIRNLKPQDFKDGYYIDEYAAKQRQKKKLKTIRKQEREVIKRNKKPLTQKQIRNRRIIVSAALLLAVLIVGAILSLTVLFKTEKIDIEGNKYYYDDQIIGFSNVELQQNIFMSALNSTPEDISKNLPYIEKAEIGVAVPDTVTIKLTNAVPSYAVKDGNGYLIVSSKGRILDKANANNDNLTELICSEIATKEPGAFVEFTDSNVPEILESVAKSLSDNGVKNVTALNVKDLSNITFNYDNHITVKLGLPEDLDYKIRTAMKIITEKLDPNKTGAIYGTLDVSTCAKNKMSHYKPAETEPPTTSPSSADAATQPSSSASAEGGNNENGVNNGENIYDNGGVYDNGEYGGGEYDYGAYDNGAYDGGYDNGTYDDGGYGDGAYSDYNAGEDTYDYGADGGYDWNAGYDTYGDNQWE